MKGGDKQFQNDGVRRPLLVASGALALQCILRAIWQFFVGRALHLSRFVFMRRLIVYSHGLLCCWLFICVAAAWSADDTQSKERPLVFVITGESNSGGVGRNSNATPKEMAPRPSVQIMNLTDGTFAFETLQLGINNLRDHFRLQDYYEIWHGFENELANAVERNEFTGHKQVHLIKTGHGGSRVSQWSEKNPSGFWKKFVDRIDAGKKQVPAHSQWVVWFSLGINDAIDKKPIDQWEKETRAHLKKIQTQLPGAIIVMTQFQSMGYPETDAAIAKIAADEAGVYAMDSTGAALVDKNHWSYVGLKTVTQRMVKITQQALRESPKRVDQ